MTLHQTLHQAWAALSGLESKVDTLEARVEDALQRRVAVGRVTPFIVQKTFSFAPFDFRPQASPIVNSAQRRTEVVRLGYSVATDSSIAAAPVLFGAAAMRVNGKGLFSETILLGTPIANLFDFEWTFSISSSERNYTQGRSITGWNARTALGSPESHRQLLISDRNPVVLRTNEFLTIKVRPILYNMDPTRNYSGDERFSVNIIGTANRTFEP